MWLAPHATDTMRVRCSEVIMRGTLTSMGVHPPWPSSPLLARPQVYSSPLRGGGWVGWGVGVVGGWVSKDVGKQCAGMPERKLTCEHRKGRPAGRSEEQPAALGTGFGGRAHLREMLAEWLLPAETTARWMSSGWPWYRLTLSTSRSTMPTCVRHSRQKGQLAGAQCSRGGRAASHSCTKGKVDQQAARAQTALPRI